jgi:hypothetical protein
MMVHDKNIGMYSLTGISSTIFTEFHEFLHDSKYLLVLGVALVFLDLRWGIKCSRLRKETIKASRAVRRTVNKMIDYFCWIGLAYLLGMTFGQSFDIHILPYIVMAVIYGVELESILHNYFGSKGKKFKWNFWKWFEKKTDMEIEIEDVNDTATKPDNKTNT